MFSLSNKRYLNILPYNPKKFFANWNLQFYKRFEYNDIASLDSAVYNPTQFIITRQVIIDTSLRLKRKIHLIITAVGTGSIVDLIEQDIAELSNYLDSITLTDIKDINLERWKLLKQSEVVLKKKIGDILNSAFITTLSGDMFYGNELFGDIPNRFIYKDNKKLYDIWIRAYTVNRLPLGIETKMKEILANIYRKNKFPETFTPELGKILSFDIAFKRRIFNRELEYFYELYPDKAIIAIADSAFEVLFYLYEQLSAKGTILFHDYGFFSFENLHLIENFLRRDNHNNPFVRNYYGEFTTDPSFDFLYHKLKNHVRFISIKKTAERVSKITGTPIELVNLDGEERKAMFFTDMIRDRLITWEITEEEIIEPLIAEHVSFVKNGNQNVDKTVDKINQYVGGKLSEDYKLSLKKILLGYFNDDDHRFLTLEIHK